MADEEQQPAPDLDPMNTSTAGDDTPEVLIIADDPMNLVTRGGDSEGLEQKRSDGDG
jgi:hypothetical protein